MAKDSTRAKFEQTCPDCQGVDFVEDHAQGDLICTNVLKSQLHKLLSLQSCGLVVEARCIDERSEWRTFGDKDGGGGVDPNRVGGPSNHLLANDLSTDIVQGRGSATLAQSLMRTAMQSGGGSDKALSSAFKRIQKLCDDLGLAKVVYDTACELYKKVHEAGVVRGRALASVIPAVVFIACRKEQTPRTFKEILTVTVDTTKRDVARSFKLITTRMEDLENAPTAHVKDYMRRFCNQLGLKHSDVVVAEEFALAACPRDGIRPDGGTRPWDGKSPLSIAAAILLITTRMPKSTGMPSVIDIANVAMVAEITVRTTAAMMYPYAAQLVPASYASKDTVGKVISRLQSGMV